MNSTNSALEKIKQHFIKIPDKMKNLTITLSRQYGCDSFPFALKLKEELEKKTSSHWTILDHSLIEEISKVTNESLNELMGSVNNQGVVSSLGKLFGRKADSSSYDLVKEFIKEMAKVGNVIIIGRGASFFTQGFLNTIHIRMVAMPEYRINYIMKLKDLSREEAEKNVEENQKKREDFLINIIKSDAHRAEYYHLFVNIGKLDKEEAMSCVMALAETRIKELQSN